MGHTDHLALIDRVPERGALALDNERRHSAAGLQMQVKYQAA